MAQKIKTVYICSECGYESPKWNGRCPGCGEYNTMNEEIVSPAKPQERLSSVTVAVSQKITEISALFLHGTDPLDDISRKRRLFRDNEYHFGTSLFI